MSTGIIDANIRGVIRDFTCGYCSAQAGYNIVFADHSELRHTYGDLLEGAAIAVLKCRDCGMLNLLVFSVNEEDYGGSMTEVELDPFITEHPHIIAAGFDKEDGAIAPMWIELMGQYPYGHKLDSIPEIIRRDLQEASNCLAIAASNAAVIMCGRVIERLAVHFGARPDQNRMLGLTLKELENRKLIDEHLLNSFREVKDWRNIGAHPSENDEGIQLTEARKVVEFVYLLIEQVFPRQDARDLANELKQMRLKKETVG